MIIGKLVEFFSTDKTKSHGYRLVYVVVVGVLEYESA